MSEPTQITLEEYARGAWRATVEEGRWAGLAGAGATPAQALDALGLVIAKDDMQKRGLDPVDAAAERMLKATQGYAKALEEASGRAPDWKCSLCGGVDMHKGWCEPGQGVEVPL